MYYVGVDLGGTNIKVGICDGEGNILKKGSIKTGAERSADEITKSMAELTLHLISEMGLTAGISPARASRRRVRRTARTASSCTAATCRFWSIRWRSASPILRVSQGAD